MPRNDTPSPPAPARRHAPARRLSRAPARLTPRAPLQVNANQTIDKVWAEVQVRKNAHRNASPLRRVLQLEMCTRQLHSRVELIHKATHMNDRSHPSVV